jgi:hypothetical protein
LKQKFLKVIISLSLLFSVIVLYSQSAVPAYAQLPEEVLVCYETLMTIPPQSVTLTDQFGVEDVDAPNEFGQTGFFLCINGLKNSDRPPETTTFWTQYFIIGTIDPPKVKLTDQFGTVIVDPVPASWLVIPAVANGTGSIEGPHWKKYDTFDFAGPAPDLNPPHNRTVSTFYGTGEMRLSEGPGFLLTPALKENITGSVSGDLTAPHLGCYFITNFQDFTINPPPLLTGVTNQFDRQERLQIFGPRFLCIPTEKEIVPTPVGGEILGIDMTTLVVVGATANAGWIIPVAGVTIAGIVGYLITRRLW